MLDDQTLLCLADTLELTMGERREFFLAATGLDNEQIYATETDPGEILASVLPAYFSKLFAQLRHNREFRWFWEQVFYEEKRYFVGGESFQLGITGTSRFSFLTTPLVTLTPHGNLEIITHVPRNVETAATFYQMAAESSARAFQYAPWSEKTTGA